MVDTHTNLQNAIPISSMRAEYIWFANVEDWTSIYIGYPNIIRLDQGESFRSDFFRTATDTHGNELKFSGTASHNSRGAGERYQIPVIRVFGIERERYTSLDPQVTLRNTVKDLNDTMGPEGMITKMMVFGTLPTVPSNGNNHRDQSARMDVIQTARREMEK